MNKDSKEERFFDFLSGVLLRCFLFGFGILLLWFVFFLAGGDWAFQIHSQWFNLSRHEFDLMNYYGMLLFKLVVVTCFLLPYLSIRMMLR